MAKREGSPNNGASILVFCQVYARPRAGRKRRASRSKCGEARGSDPESWDPVP